MNYTIHIILIAGNLTFLIYSLIMIYVHCTVNCTVNWKDEQVTNCMEIKDLIIKLKTKKLWIFKKKLWISLIHKKIFEWLLQKATDK